MLEWLILLLAVYYNYKTDWIEVFGSVGTFLIAIVAVGVTAYLAWFSPQAKLAKFEKKEKFHKKLYKHYEKLNKKIFTPLSLKIASAPRYLGSPNTFIELFNNLELEYDLGSIPEERYYKKALEHLKEDYPDYDYEKDVKSLQEEIGKLNKEVRELRDEMEKKVENSLRVHAKVVKGFPISPDSIFIPHILELLTIYWHETLFEYKKGEKSLEEILSGLQPFKTRFRKGSESQCISYGGIDIMGKDLQEKDDEIISTIDKLKENGELVKKLVKLEGKQRDLISKSRGIAEKFEELSDSIDNEEYNTRASCCPTEE